MSAIWAIILVLVEGILVCVIAHAFDSNYGRASLLAAVTGSIIIQLQSYIEVGYWEPFWPLSLAISFPAVLAMALIVGIPITNYRIRRIREAERTMAGDNYVGKN